MPNEDLDYELLRELAREPSASQRSLASRLGISVGKVNYCMRELLVKGLIKMRNFSNSRNKLSYAYLLTPSGVTAKARLTAEYLRIKVDEYASLKREIAQLRLEASRHDAKERSR